MPSAAALEAWRNYCTGGIARAIALATGCAVGWPCFDLWEFNGMPRKLAAALVVLAISSTSMGVFPISVAHADESRKVIHQLRVYEIFEANKQAFHERFRDHAARIMAKYDFEIVAMWEARSDERTEFVYLLEWPDEQTMKDRWAKFMADREWSEIKKKTGAVHGALVGDIEDRALRLTDYSPRP